MSEQLTGNWDASLLADPGFRRLVELARAGEPRPALDATSEDIMSYARAQLAIVLDEMMAQVLRNARTGRKGMHLREQGFTATADELESWQLPG